MATTFSPADLVISEAQLLPLAEVLNLPPDRLMGVTSDALDALTALRVSTVFDLALSSVFNAAVQIDDAADDQANPMNRFGRPITDLLKPGIAGTVAVPDLRNQSIDILADIEDAATVQAALGVTTVRDLSVYPPFRAAKEILSRAFFPEQLEAFDAESPADLVPKTGEFPTERVQYSVLVLDELRRPENAPPLIDLAGPDFQPIDVAPVADPNFGFSTLGLGMLLTLNQSWFMQGVTLGHLLHSMALAAGESTRIAVIDWSRKVSAGQTELIGETEDLSQDTSRNRTISEVTEAVAREAQTGFSHTESKSVTKQAGAAGGGIIGGVFGFGASASIAKTSTSADSYATSAGSREVGASMLQQASDRTHQHAHAAERARERVHAGHHQLQPHACADGAVLRGAAGVSHGDLGHPLRPRGLRALQAARLQQHGPAAPLPRRADRCGPDPRHPRHAAELRYAGVRAGTAGELPRTRRNPYRHPHRSARGPCAAHPARHVGAARRANLPGGRRGLHHAARTAGTSAAAPAAAFAGG